MHKLRETKDRRIFFPWEGRGGLRRFISVGRVGPFVFLSVLVAFVVWVGVRERHAAGERETWVGLESLRNAVARYIVEQEGSCPPSLEAVTDFLPRPELPRDGWGRPFRLVCPSDRPGYDYVVMSDGPDGEPGGLDRIEY